MCDCGWAPWPSGRSSRRSGPRYPKSVVTLVAVTVGKSQDSKDIGVGAAMGGPLALATIAYGVTGAMLLLRIRRQAALAMRVQHAPEESDGPDVQDGAEQLAVAHRDLFTGVDGDRLARDQTWFLAIFIVKVALGLVAFAFKPWLGLAFFPMYAVYFVREMSDDREAHSDADPSR